MISYKVIRCMIANAAVRCMISHKAISSEIVINKRGINADKLSGYIDYISYV